MKWGRFTRTLSLLLLALLLPLSAFGNSQEEETYLISESELTSLEQALTKQTRRASALQTNLLEREETLGELRTAYENLRQHLQVVAMRLGQSAAALADSERRLRRINAQLTQLEREHERQKTLSIEFEAEALKQGRRKALWQTIAIGAAVGATGAIVTDSPWIAAAGFAGGAAITIGIRSIGRQEDDE